MRSVLAAGLSLAVLALTTAAAAEGAKPARQATAASAERYGVAASYRAPSQGRGYSDHARHMADCLASYRHYDPRTDRVVLRTGLTRRCPL